MCDHKEKKKNGLLIFLFVLCLSSLLGCGKDHIKDHEDPVAQITSGLITMTEAPLYTPGPTFTPAPPHTSSPTPTTIPWESYERIGNRKVYKVPIKELTGDVLIAGVRCKGDYVLLQLLEKEFMDEKGSIFLLLRPCISGDTVSYNIDYNVGAFEVLADGTVFIEDAETGSIHVFDSSFNNIGNIASEENKYSMALAITDDGHIWRTDDTLKGLSVCDRNGDNTIFFELDECLSVYQDLGGIDDKRFFIAMTSSEQSDISDIMLCANMTTGEIKEVKDKFVDVVTGEIPGYISTSGKITYDRSNETWFIHSIDNIGQRVIFPKHYRNEHIDGTNEKGNRLCVGGQVWKNDSDDPFMAEPYGCSVYDISKGLILGNITTSEVVPYSSICGKWIKENDLVLMTAGRMGEDGYENVDILLWDLSDDTPEPIIGFSDPSEEELTNALNKLSEEYREIYGIVYKHEAMKTVDRDEQIEILRAIDLFNFLARGIINDPEEFDKGEDGIALRIENINGHERGHSEFDPHVFSELNTLYHGDGQVEAFYNLVDALRAGEDYFECKERQWYNMAVVRLITWFYPAGTGLIDSPYYFGGDDQWKNGIGMVDYIIPKEKVEEEREAFEKLICDTLDDCISDDYTDFEKALALYEYITTYWTYDYDLYLHLNETEWSDVGSLYRCLYDKTGICWEIAGIYEYLLLQCGINAEDINGANTDTNEYHAWSYITLDGKWYNVDPTWGLTYGIRPSLKYFCFNDEERINRDHFIYDTCFAAGTDEMKCGLNGICANDDRYSSIWDGYYVGMDRVAKTVLYEDRDGKLRKFRYGE